MEVAPIMSGMFFFFRDRRCRSIGQVRGSYRCRRTWRKNRIPSSSLLIATLQAAGITTTTLPQHPNSSCPSSFFLSGVSRKQQITGRRNGKKDDTAWHGSLANRPVPNNCMPSCSQHSLVHYILCVILFYFTAMLTNLLFILWFQFQFRKPRTTTTGMLLIGAVVSPWYMITQDVSELHISITQGNY